MNELDFSEKTVLVTGGERGIGKRVCLDFALHGANVVVNYPFIEELSEAEKTLNEINNIGGKAIILRADVRNIDEIDEMVSQAVQEFGKIDILVNNAGITKDNLLIKMSPHDWQNVIDINLTGTFNCTKRVVKEMMKNKYGRIVNISSIMGIIGNAGQANYAASKAGIIAFTKSVAKEFGSRNITANVVAPGYIKSPMTDNLAENIKKAFFDKVIIKRFGEAEDISNAILFLASDLANYITGQVLVVDGGLTL